MLWALRMNPIGRGATDEDGEAVAEAIQQPGRVRDQLTSGLYQPQQAGEPLYDLEQAFTLAIEAKPLYERIRQAVREGTLAAARPKHLADEAHAQGVISEQEFELLRKADRARRQDVAVDAFDLSEMPMNLPRPEPRPRQTEAAD